MINLLYQESSWSGKSDNPTPCKTLVRETTSKSCFCGSLTLSGNRTGSLKMLVH